MRQAIFECDKIMFLGILQYTNIVISYNFLQYPLSVINIIECGKFHKFINIKKIKKTSILHKSIFNIELPVIPPALPHEASIF